jgi:hypothetical protein
MPALISTLWRIHHVFMNMNSVHPSPPRTSVSALATRKQPCNTSPPQESRPMTKNPEKKHHPSSQDSDPAKSLLVFLIALFKLTVPAQSIYTTSFLLSFPVPPSGFRSHLLVSYGACAKAQRSWRRRRQISDSIYVVRGSERLFG